MSGARTVTAIAVAAMMTALVHVQLVAAQPVHPTPTPGLAPDDPPSFHRPPFVLGFDVGLSALRVDQDSDEGGRGIGGALRAGYLVNQHVALLLELSFSRTTDTQNDTFDSATLTVPSAGVQGWLTPHLWVRGAVGHGTIEAEDERTLTEGTAFMGTVGYELVREQTFSIDLQVRVGAMYDDSGTTSRSSALLLGVTSYGLGGLGVWIGK
jgi:hypothetical protein